jgi:hypothetical protein
LSLGYKYNSKRVLKFVTTASAGSTKAGVPYDMKFCNAYNNVCVRKVEQPVIVSQFFDDSNCIDSYNHVHQLDLALEKRWFTQDPFFRLHTTLTGMTVADVWRLSQYHKLISNAKYEDGLNVLTLKKFTGVLDKQLIKIAMSCDAALDPLLSPTAASISSSVVSPLTSDDSTASSFTFTQAEFIDTMGTYHTPSLLPMTEQKNGKKHRRQRHCQWCKTKHGKLHCTVWTCHTCTRPSCMPTDNNDGRNYFALHVRNCVPAETRGKRRRNIVLNAKVAWQVTGTIDKWCM